MSDTESYTGEIGDARIAPKNGTASVVDEAVASVDRLASVVEKELTKEASSVVLRLSTAEIEAVDTAESRAQAILSSVVESRGGNVKAKWSPIRDASGRLVALRQGTT